MFRVHGATPGLHPWHQLTAAVAVAEELHELGPRHRRETLSEDVGQGDSVQGLAADRDDLDVGDALQRLPCPPAHDFAAQREPVAGAQHQPAHAAGHGLGAGTDLGFGQGH
jgi:hypothetical protein